MTIEEAIKKAIEDGGFHFTEQFRPISVKEVKRHSFASSDFSVEYNMQSEKNDGELWYRNTMVFNPFLDPAFWQSLGKAMGWHRKIEIEYKTGLAGDGPIWMGGELEEWEYRWHRLIDHLAAGKTAEDYFADLT